VFKVAFIWRVPPQLRKHFKLELSELEVAHRCCLAFAESTSEDDLLALARDATVVVGWRPPEKLLREAKRLVLFQNPGVGVQHLVPMFRRHPEITLCNCHGNTYFTAQHALALLLSLTNKVIPHHNWMSAGRWRTGDEDAKSIPLRERTVGILGFGHLGQDFARFIRGFSVKVLAYQRRSLRGTPEKRDLIGEAGIVDGIMAREAGDSLDAFLDLIDTLVITLPLTDETRGVIGSHELSLLGPEGLLVNVGRGPVVDEKSLYDSLDKGAIAGAALDVWYEYDPEPTSDGKSYPSNYPFHLLNNVVLSPHRGASPMDDIARWNNVIENIKRAAAGRRDFIGVVNVDAGY